MSVMCCLGWCQFIFSPLTGINIIKGRGVWMSAHHLPVERKWHVWYAPHLSMADVHHLLILQSRRRLTSNESAGFLHPETNAPKANQHASYWKRRPSPSVWCGILICLKVSLVISKWAWSSTFTPVASVLQQITFISTIGFNFLYVDEINHIQNVHHGVFMVWVH